MDKRQAGPLRKATVDYYWFAVSNSCYSEPIEIDTTIFEDWRLDPEVKSLHYLWKPIKEFQRWVRWMNRQSAPRWSANRWKAKT